MSGSLYDPAISRLMQTNPELAAIERRRMLAAMLMKQGLDYHDAVEHFEFNIIGGWLGDMTPIFNIPVEEFP